MPATVATNCCVVSVPVDGAINVNAGAIETVGVPLDPVRMIVAVPLFVGSAWLVAVSVTGFTVGRRAGAKYCTGVVTGPNGSTQGLLGFMQIWPSVPLPLGIPFTDQVTLESEVPCTVAEKAAI